jgi:hypothetical protein
MQVNEIKTRTFSQIFSEIGGFKFNILSILGFISSIVLPYLFLNKLSFEVKKKNNGNQINDQNYFKNYLKNIFSYENFIQLNMWIDDFKTNFLKF